MPSLFRYQRVKSQASDYKRRPSMLKHTSRAACSVDTFPWISLLARRMTQLNAAPSSILKMSSLVGKHYKLSRTPFINRVTGVPSFYDFGRFLYRTQAGTIQTSLIFIPIILLLFVYLEA